jgi:hypothetical protein
MRGIHPEIRITITAELKATVGPVLRFLGKGVIPQPNLINSKDRDLKSRHKLLFKDPLISFFPDLPPRHEGSFYELSSFATQLPGPPAEIITVTSCLKV